MRTFIPLLLLSVSSTALADGATTYKQYCSSCHGDKGAGDGIAASALPVKPASFADAGFWSRDDATVKKAIKEGGAAVGKSPMMAPFGAQLSDAQIDELVKYLKTLKK